MHDFSIGVVNSRVIRMHTYFGENVRISRAVEKLDSVLVKRVKIAADGAKPGVGYQEIGVRVVGKL